ncbi:MAG: hypothetical protein A4E63_02792 [Syntrophorhabdus sp. PtaU1.Bin050]|nr:MAG: hypothetical protein A4E63_02792 [Syntrophorhabdus sp. PtaU1.Bin050]
METTGKRIVIIGTLDTKADQLIYLREKIEARGHRPILIDLSTGREPPRKAEVTAAEIASLTGKNIERLRSAQDRADAAQAMTTGLELKVLELFSHGEVDGIVALGGATTTNMASRVMQKLPFGVPKALGVTAVMPAFAGIWFNATDIVVMQTIIEFAGMNDLVKSVIERLAGTISGMTEEARPHDTLQLPYPSIAITEYGFSQKCAQQVRTLLEEKGYHVFSFSAQGISDRAMEKLISQGFLHGVIDIVPSGLSDALTGGRRASGKERLDAAAEKGIPQVLTPAGINMTGCGPTRQVDKEKYNSRPRILKMDEQRWMTRYTPEELKEHAKVYAGKLNKSKGPTMVLVPLRGWSSADREGGILYDPDEDKIFVEELKKHLKPEVGILEIDSNLEDVVFAEAVVDNFDKIFKKFKGIGA